MRLPDRSDLQHPGLSRLNKIAKPPRSHEERRASGCASGPAKASGAIGHAGTFGSGDLVGEDASARRGPVEQSAGIYLNPLIGR